jgi:site-specific DNA-adenine methylase
MERVRKDFNPKATPPLLHFGGKFKLGGWITSHFPAHEGRATLFGGGMSEFLRLPRLYTGREIYRDCNPATVNFWLRLQQEPEALAAATSKAAKSEITPARFDGLQERFETLEDAAELLLHSHTSFNGSGLRWCGGISSQKLREVKAGIISENFKIFLMAWSKRIAGIDFRKESFFTSIYQMPKESLVYLDPPYPHALRGSKDSRHKSQEAALSRKQYAFEFSDGDHKALVSIVSSMGDEKAIALSSLHSPEGANPIYSRLLDEGWGVVTTRCSHRSVGEPSMEALYLSPELMRRKEAEGGVELEAIKGSLRAVKEMAVRQ